MRIPVILSVLVPFAALPAQTALATFFGSTNTGQLGTRLCAAGDVDGDGVPDFVVSEPNSSASVAGACYVISGATHAVIRTFLGSTANNMWGLGSLAINRIGDVDGDGHADFAIGYTNYGALDVFSGATGARIYRAGTLNPFFQNVCDVGDVDADGRDDFVAYVYANSNHQLWVISGRTGAPTTQLAAYTSAILGLVNVGDLNGDGYPEVAAVGGSSLEIYSLHPPTLLHQFQLNNSQQTPAQIRVADIDHDGHKEVVIGFSYVGIQCYSPTTGAVLRQYALPSGAPGYFDVLNDIDGDGYDDLIALGGPDPILGGGIAILSGANGSYMGTWTFQSTFLGAGSILGVGDVDGDGFDDFAISNSYLGNAQQGGWQLISGRLLGCMASEPVNCYGGPFPPQLGVTRPSLGSTMAIVGRDAPLGAPGALVSSFLPATWINLGANGCNAWIDPQSAFVLGLLPPNASWQTNVPIPNLRGLIGTQLAFQAVYFGTNGPLGYDLTNGIWARVGY